MLYLSSSMIPSVVLARCWVSQSEECRMLFQSIAEKKKKKGNVTDENVKILIIK